VHDQSYGKRLEGRPAIDGGFSQTRLARMHAAMQSHVEGGRLPGLVALVSRRGCEHVETIGKLAFGSSAPMRRDTIFRLASMTKPITAVAAMILVEECKLRLDEPVDESRGSFVIRGCGVSIRGTGCESGRAGSLENRPREELPLPTPQLLCVSARCGRRGGRRGSPRMIQRAFLPPEAQSRSFCATASRAPCHWGESPRQRRSSDSILRVRTTIRTRPVLTSGSRAFGPERPPR